MSREKKIKAIRQYLTDGNADQFLDELLVSIPSWVVNEYESDITKLQKRYGPVVIRGGKFFTVSKMEIPKHKK